MKQFLVLDLDETLIANSFRCAQPSDKIRIVSIQSEFGYTDRFIPRPFAGDFLHWCKENFSHILLATFSSRTRAEDVLASTGLRQYFDLIVSREALESSVGSLLSGGDPERSYDFGDDFCLVDDQSWNSDHVLIKMNFFGVDVRPVVDAELSGSGLDRFEPIDAHLIQAPDYEGDPEDDFFQRLLRAFQENYIPDDKVPA